MKITTEDCRRWLVESDEAQQLVRDRCGVTDGEPYDDADDWIRWGQTPKKWKRTRKYKVGSNADEELLLAKRPNASATRH